LGFRASKTPRSGAYVCAGCDQWFPSESDVADFAPPSIRHWERWRAFWDRHGEELSLAPLPSPNGSGPADAAAASARNQQEFFDEHATSYDDEMSDSSSFWNSHDSLVLGSWISSIPTGSSVVDLGAGTGRCTFPLVDRQDASASLLAVDVSFGMLKQAADRLHTEGRGGRVVLAVGDCMNLSFIAPGIFDVAVAHGLLHHVKEPDRVFESWARISAAESNMLIHDNNRSVFRPIFDLLMKWRATWDNSGHEWHPVIPIADLRGWASRYGFETNARTSVFVPPHLCELLSPSRSRTLIATTDRWAMRVPFLRDQGGIILAEVYRGRGPLLGRNASRNLERAHA